MCMGAAHSACFALILHVYLMSFLPVSSLHGIALESMHAMLGADHAQLKSRWCSYPKSALDEYRDVSKMA